MLSVPFAWRKKNKITVHSSLLWLHFILLFLWGWVCFFKFPVVDNNLHQSPSFIIFIHRLIKHTYATYACRCLSLCALWVLQPEGNSLHTNSLRFHFIAFAPYWTSSEFWSCSRETNALDTAVGIIPVPGHFEVASSLELPLRVCVDSLGPATQWTPVSYPPTHTSMLVHQPPTRPFGS